MLRLKGVFSFHERFICRATLSYPNPPDLSLLDGRLVEDI